MPTVKIILRKNKFIPNWMTTKIHFISVEKTATVVTSGNTDASNIWLILHGYGQHAEHFQKEFSLLDEKDHYCVFPEALHRFYLKSGKGDTGASWMTKYQRETDNSDNNHYLDKVYSHFILPFIDASKHFIVLGFSQGAASLIRWLAHSNVNVDKIVLWGAVFPPDMQKDEYLKLLTRHQWYYFIGDEDEFISDEEKIRQKIFFEQHKFKIRWIEYKGKHHILPDILLKNL